MIKTIVFKIAMCLWFFILSPVVLIGLISAKSTRRIFIFSVFGMLWLARAIAGVRWEVIDTVQSRAGKIDPRCVIASKHMSILEIAVLMVTFQNAFFIMKKGLLFIPIYGWAFWRMGFVAVDRRKGATNMKAVSDRVSIQINKGLTLAIFPEGTRKKPGEGVRLKGGLFYIASTLRLPILPVGTDAGLYWPKKGHMRRGTAKVWLEPMLPYDAPVDDVAAAIARNSV